MTDTTAHHAADAFLRASDAPWLLIGHLPGLGDHRWQALVDHLPDPLELLDFDVATLKALGLKPPARDAILAWQHGDTNQPVLARAMAAWQRCEALNIQRLHWADPDYPALLRETHGAPPLLYLAGHRDVLSRPQLAMVGSRKATRAGLEHARQFARALTERGFVVTSGMALGIDGAAHQGALDANGATIGVLGTGIDVPYPAAHRALARAIPERGALLSEYPPGTRARAGHFPRRNRLISGLSQGTLVVEANLRSGSLITARLALEQGREVFAIPGAINNPQARGCHRLIRQGATLVETVDDIEEELANWGPPAKASTTSTADEKPAESAPPPVPEHLGGREQQILRALEFETCSTDTLCDRTGLTADVLMQSILMLELEGLILTVPGGYQRG